MVFILIVIIGVLVIIGLSAFVHFFISSPVKTKQVNTVYINTSEIYQKPKLKTLTIKQIEQIHSKGMLTPAEKVKEWESLDLCAPGDAIGSAAHRCKKFHHNCHDCLIDYANQKDEYESILNNLKPINNI